MSVTHNCPCDRECGLQHAMEMIGGKWKMPILCALIIDGPVRYNDLKRKLAGISNTMLAKSLKELEENALLTRTEYPEVPIRVEYAATEKSRALAPILLELSRWAFS